MAKPLVAMSATWIGAQTFVATATRVGLYAGGYWTIGKVAEFTIGEIVVSAVINRASRTDLRPAWESAEFQMVVAAVFAFVHGDPQAAAGILALCAVSAIFQCLSVFPKVVAADLMVVFGPVATGAGSAAYVVTKKAWRKWSDWRSSRVARQTRPTLHPIPFPASAGVTPPPPGPPGPPGDDDSDNDSDDGSDGFEKPSSRLQGFPCHFRRTVPARLDSW